ncbi:MAG: site-2 protease family protein, partial [Thermoanaerobaculia bacterium]|nr:site-2 protease family protein [Thermoanaerobaculia bacterium]
MKWSFRIGTLFGIPVYVHATFALLLLWIGLAHWREGGAAAALQGIAFLLALFGCVVLHELGHALTARRFGIQTQDVTLLPIGGVARLERMPEEPRQELLVALAGPAVNVVLAAGLAIWLAAAAALVPIETLSVTGGSFLARLLAVNVMLVVFNLVPAFPMDGGRVLRALLATKVDYSRATRIAASIGQGFALLFGFAGLFWNPFLIFIALFVWIGAAAEAGQVETRTALAGVPVRQAMLTDFRVLAAESKLEEAVRLTLEGSQKDFPVTHGGNVVGVLCQGDLLEALARSG